MPVADVVERLATRELLVAGEEVDRRVAERAAPVVEVAAVDVDPRAVEAVDDLAEAAEVHGDEVVDLQAGEQSHGLERALRAARGVGRVDLVEERRAARAPDLDAHVAREREERDRVGRGVGADEHQRVRAPARPVALAGVVADDERDGGLARERDVERLGGLADGRRLCGDGGDRLVEVEIRATRRARRDDEAGDAQPHGHAADEPEPRAWRPPGLPVEGHGRGGAGREHRLPVPVRRGAAPQASFQGGSHGEVRSALTPLSSQRSHERPARRPTAEDSSATGRGSRPGGRFPPKLLELLTRGDRRDVRQRDVEDGDLGRRARGDAESVGRAERERADGR